MIRKSGLPGKQAVLIRSVLCRQRLQAIQAL